MTTGARITVGSFAAGGTLSPTYVQKFHRDTLFLEICRVARTHASTHASTHALYIVLRESKVHVRKRADRMR